MQETFPVIKPHEGSQQLLASFLNFYGTTYLLQNILTRLR
jgi:hypothetical protein